MTRLLLAVLYSIAIFFTVTPAVAFTPAQLWSKRFGDVTPDEARAVATDASGNVFVAGSFQGTVNFGGGGLISAGSNDIFLAKYNANGVHQWSQRFGSPSSDAAYSVAVDGLGNVIFIGSFTGTVNFGGGGLASVGGNDIVVAKYSTNGAHLWSQRFGSTGADDGYAVAVDVLNNVFIAGAFNLTVSFGGVGLTSLGASDIFLAKYNSGGGYQWSQRYGSTGFDTASAVTVDGSGNAIMTGSFQNTVNFGGIDLISVGGYDIFLAKYNSGGGHIWSQRYGAAGTDTGNSIARDASGNVYVTGYFNGTVNFGGSALISAGAADIFVAKYNLNGAHQWSRRYGSTGGEFGNSIAVDAIGNVTVTGSFQNSVDFGGGALQAMGSSDVFVANYDGSATHRWSRGVGSSTDDFGYAVAADGSGNAFAAGAFSGTVDFGSGGLTSAGAGDVFLVKFSAVSPEPVIISIRDIGNDQGGKVKIRFARSGYDDAGAWLPVTDYETYRRDDPPPSASAFVPRATATLSKQQLLDDGWTQVGSVGAHAQSSYGMDVPTIGDSTAAGSYHSTFFIRAATNVPATYFDSPPDSGQSVDNLAPSAPVNLIFTTNGRLFWSGSPAADFDYFTVYGSNTNNFGVAVVIGYTILSTLDVSPSPYLFYFVTATDFSGNESAPGSTAIATGVGGTPASFVLSVTNYPNPFNPRTSLNYTVPSRAPVTISVHDASGARVAMLVNKEVRDAGAHHVEWDGRDDRGAVVSSGVYFARIEHNGATRTKKMVMLK